MTCCTIEQQKVSRVKAKNQHNVKKNIRYMGGLSCNDDYVEGAIQIENMDFDQKI